MEWGDKIPIGIIYRNNRKIFEDSAGLTGTPALTTRATPKEKLRELYAEFK
jgi:hypothetical protein